MTYVNVLRQAKIARVKVECRPAIEEEVSMVSETPITLLDLYRKKLENFR